MLIMDMPETCYECPFLDEADNCLAMNIYYTDVEVMIEKPTWCPLKEVPKKKEVSKYDGYCMNMACTERNRGYNACIDKILGG